MLQQQRERNNSFRSHFNFFDEDDDFFGSSLFPTRAFDPFAEMEDMMRNVSSNSGYSSSSFSSYSYSSNGCGQPVVIQKTINERRNGRDMTERHETYSNSAEGIEKATVGRRIGDRARIIEKSRKMASGEESTLDTLHNLDQNSAVDFDREWQSRSSTTGHYLPSARQQQLGGLLCDGRDMSTNMRRGCGQERKQSKLRRNNQQN